MDWLAGGSAVIGVASLKIVAIAWAGFLGMETMAEAEVGGAVRS